MLEVQSNDLNLSVYYSFARDLSAPSDIESLIVLSYSLIYKFN